MSSANVESSAARSANTRSTSTAEPSRDFIRERIAQDLENGVHQQIVTRFPPEPNGFPHIGHAKSICLNFGIANEFKGVCHLRFDDTNPTTENVEYVEAIQRDVRWLGFDWGDKLFFASDYFEELYQFAIQLIRDGKAYVCSLSEDEIREYRGTISEPGRNSPYRERSVEDNLDLFERMRAGEFDEGAHVLRARINMAATNMKMRDPLLYRIRKAHHYRTGNDWPIYPMYDFAHCLSDAIEGVTHSLCTLEFENNRELYDWVIDNVEVDSRPRQTEFARLNLSYTIASKRKLLQLVEEGHVAGWDDPRMPTLSGLRRRGYTPEAIRNFCERIGVARTHNVIDFAQLEYSLRDDLNQKAPRVLAVLRPLKVVLENYPEDQVEELDAPFFPHDVPKDGSRAVPFSRTLYIDREDFEENPPEGYFRLAPGREVRLRYAYFIRCREVIKNDAGEVVELRCTYDPETRGGNAPDGRQVKGTIHWVSAEHSLPAKIRLYDRLFLDEEPGARDDFREALNPESLITLDDCRVEPSLGESKAGDAFQFERLGYFVADLEEHGEDHRVFNRAVTLRDTWAKIAGQAEAKAREEAAARKAAAKAAHKERQRQLALESEGEKRALDAAGEERFARFHDDLELSEQDASLLAQSEALSSFFLTALDAHQNPRTVANWIINELLRELKERSLGDLPFGPADLGALVALVDSGEINGKIGKDVLAEMIENGGEPSAIVDRHGWRQVRDTDALRQAIRGVLDKHSDKAAQYRDGKTALFGFFIGQVMQATRGQADPQLVRQLLTEELG